MSGYEGLKVLLLEDSRFDAEILRENLLAMRPDATLDVVTGREGFVQALADRRYDVILSDYELPGYGGAQALDHALQVAPQTPFIFVSGVIGEDNAVEMLKRGATDYVSKGRLGRLSVVLERALREVAQRDATGKAERLLREAGAMYARVVESLRDYAVILLDADGNIRTWNPAAGEIFGYDTAEVAGRSARLLFTEQDRAHGVFEHEMDTARAQGKAGDNRWMLRKNGSTFWAEGLLAPLFRDSGSRDSRGDVSDPAAAEPGGYTKILRDGTQAWQAARALEDARDEAERANRAKDRFLAVLSHELRTPLTPIGAAAHVLEHNASVAPEHRHLLPMIRRNVALEARLIDDLLDLTAITSGKVNLRMAPVDMHRLVGVVIDMLADQVSERQLRLSVQLEAQTAYVEADEARMHQVIWNILRNAVKFTAPGGAITLKTESVAGQFIFSCTDNGIGIEPAALSRIFTAFEQADTEVSERFGGLGLGLAIARGLVNEHDGELSVRSDGRGEGATFTLMLNALPDGDSAGTLPVPGSADAGLPSFANAAGKDIELRLLLVEDNPDSADVLRMGLQAYGYAVTLASSRAGALAAGRQADFDVVVTDLGLPDGSGLDIGRALSPRCPVIALSGYGTPQDIERSTAAGFSGHIVKPADFSAVHSMVQKVLRGKTRAGTGTDGMPGQGETGR
ncbi:MAG: response regulator [Comamonadaceae bacterium]|nr:MAG: response regulator [Comamonadaceae bacterium]